MISLANGNFFGSWKHLNNKLERARFIPWGNDRETPTILLIQEWQVTPVAALYYQAGNNHHQLRMNFNLNQKDNEAPSIHNLDQPVCLYNKAPMGRNGHPAAKPTQARDTTTEITGKF
jgi:hypothetical protein